MLGNSTCGNCKNEELQIPLTSQRKWEVEEDFNATGMSSPAQLCAPAELSVWLANQCTMSHLQRTCHNLLGYLSETRQMNHSPKDAFFSPVTSQAKQQLKQMTCFRQPMPSKINPTCRARQHYLLKLYLNFYGHINIAIYVPFLLDGKLILHFCLTHAPTNCFYDTFCKSLLSHFSLAAPDVFLGSFGF